MWIDIAERSSNYFKKLRKVKRGDNVLRTNAFGECPWLCEGFQRGQLCCEGLRRLFQQQSSNYLVGIKPLVFQLLRRNKSEGFPITPFPPSAY
jgi:hypothetical protein